MRRIAITGLIGGVVLGTGSACGGGALESTGEENTTEQEPVTASVAEGDYVIKSVHSGKCLAIADESTEKGADLVQDACDGSKSQTFHFALLSGGYYEIKNLNSGKVIEVAGASTAKGAPLQQWDDKNTANQQFQAIALGGGQFSLRVRQTNFAVDVAKASKEDGATVLQWPWSGNPNQKWALVHPSASAQAPTLKDTVIQKGLDAPWDIAFPPDGRMIVTERIGHIKIFESTAANARLLKKISIDNIYSGASEVEAGALGMTLDPDFSRNGYLYVCASRHDENQLRTQLLRYKSSGDSFVFDTYILRRGVGANHYHDGCRVRFGPDGKIWMTTGTGMVENRAQDPNSLNGKILRMNKDGSVPSDNPILHGASGRSVVYDMGHRNPQGLAFNPADGRGWAVGHEHHKTNGIEQHDALTAIKPGANYGWPNPAGPGSGYDSFAWTSDEKGMACSGGAFVSGANWGSWQNHFFVGCMTGAQLAHFSISGSKAKKLTSLYHNKYGRLRSPVFGPDGALYVTTDRHYSGGPTDKIIKIVAKVAPRSALDEFEPQTSQVTSTSQGDSDELDDSDLR